MIAGEDSALNGTRMQLLKSRYDVTSFGVEESFQRLQRVRADLLLVCHSVPIDAAAWIIEMAAQERVVRQILWLSEWHTIPGLVVSGKSVIQIDSRKQPWLAAVDRVMESIKAEAQTVNKSPYRQPAGCVISSNFS
jgi:hypothetical protein